MVGSNLTVQCLAFAETPGLSTSLNQMIEEAKAMEFDAQWCYIDVG